MKINIIELYIITCFPGVQQRASKDKCEIGERSWRKFYCLQRRALVLTNISGCCTCSVMIDGTFAL